jgi:hypothetical protein
MFIVRRMEGKMNKNIRKPKMIQDIKILPDHDKYLQEYHIIKDKLALVDREEVFPLLVRLTRICKKLQITLPSEYIQYYIHTKEQLITELKKLEKMVTLSQINNENYSKLDEKITNISRKLGISV